MAHAFDLSTGEAEAGRPLSLRPAWCTEVNSKTVRKDYIKTLGKERGEREHASKTALKNIVLK